MVVRAGGQGHGSVTIHLTRRAHVALCAIAITIAMIMLVRPMHSGAGEQPAWRYTASAQDFGRDLRVLAYAEGMQKAQFQTLRTIAYANALRAQEELATLRAIAYAQAIDANTKRAAPMPIQAAAPRTAPAPPPAAPPPRPASGNVSYTVAVLDGINARRASAGLPPLASDARLASAATSYAQTMLRLNQFGHSVDGTSFDARIRAAGFTENVALGEIIAMHTGGPEPATMVQMWMDSPPHRSQIVSATFRLAGVGCAFAGSEVRCVVEFAG